MKKTILSTVTAAILIALGLGVLTLNVYAEEAEQQEEATEIRTSLTISPASQTLELTSNMNYDGVFSITNDSDHNILVEVFAAPYSYVYSEEDDEYKLGYTYENSFTQLSRWIKLKNKSGLYETKPTFTIKPGETENVNYKVSTPDGIPAGGQYAVIFAQVKNSGVVTGAIQADPSLGMIIYGRSLEGEIVVSSEVRNAQVGRGVKNEGDTENPKEKPIIFGSAKVKNTGNVDFFAKGTLEVAPIIGFSSYKTPDDKGILSIIPETELTVSDEWDEIPSFGIYKATFTVMSGTTTEVVEQILFLFSPISIILCLIVLTIIIVGVIMLVKRRKTKKSRLAI